MSDIDKRLEELAANPDHFKHEVDDARKQGQALAAALLRARKALRGNGLHALQQRQAALADSELEEALGE